MPLNYLGRKKKLGQFLKDAVSETTGWKTGEGRVFFDVFAGTGTVGLEFKESGFRIVANDIQYYAYCINRALIGLNRQPTFSRLVNKLPSFNLPPKETVLRFLNLLQGKDGFVFKNYCMGGGKESARLYFSDENGRKCDSIRARIESWRQEGYLKEGEYFYLVTSLLVAADQVANTAAVYAAFLKKLKRTASRSIQLKSLEIKGAKGTHRVHQKNGADLVSRVPCDVLYMDPPYNQRQYCTNYHVLETIAKYDDPTVQGITGLRPYKGQKSDFCSKGKALGALEVMVRRTRARYVFLSYSSEGLMARRDILDVMGSYGEVDVKTKRYPRFRADVDGKNRKYKANSVTEFLFRLRKQ